jgi:hypothetical protein
MEPWPPAGWLWVIWVIVFMLQVGASMAMLWVIWVIVFCVTQMTQSVLHKRTRAGGSLGHLGHFVIE